MRREHWGTRLGIILAVAGSAVGLGNFLRFPVQAAQNGGGAFMIPYLVALLFLAIPLCWVEWTMGRAAGARAHGSGPGILNTFWNHRAARYFGAIGVFIPIVIYCYYVYIEAWCLGYAWFALTGELADAARQGQAAGFLSAFQGLKENQWFSTMGAAFAFFIIAFLANFFVIYLGVARGIEALSKIAMPLLVILGMILMARVLTLGAPDAAQPDWSAFNGLGFMWNPDFGALADAKVWLAAAGQIFFTSSVGLGLIITYASYLKKDDDVALSGLSAISINEFVEVVIGGSIAIPAAFIFFGPVGVEAVAKGGSFNLGFVTMPMVFVQMPLAAVMGVLWFFLLFLAGVTSSVSMLQPAIAFLEDEFKLKRRQSVAILGAFTFLACQPAIWFLDKGVLDMMDFWAGTFMIVVFATGEVIIFSWIYGVDRGFEEMHHGADLRVPGVFKFIIKYVTPLYLIALLTAWFWQDGIDALLLRNVPEENFWYALGAMLGMAGFLALLVILVEIAWRRKEAK
ncbi:MAG: sodium-dependent transporter [Nitrospinae bacterium]|nr:sodium-dependent transporter [Nitrospinota bacterium]